MTRRKDAITAEYLAATVTAAAALLEGECSETMQRDLALAVKVLKTVGARNGLRQVLDESDGDGNG